MAVMPGRVLSSTVNTRRTKLFLRRQGATLARTDDRRQSDMPVVFLWCSQWKVAERKIGFWISTPGGQPDGTVEWVP
eukprot:scaffold491506_cov32-Prasinocladus_malaysianus.AAC.1